MRWLALISLAVLVSRAGCSETSYRGDGTLRDRGWYWGSGRYTLDLGDVDLSSRSVRHYAVANLPFERFAIGLGFRTTLPGQAVVHLKLAHAAGTVIDEPRPLSEWLQSSSSDFAIFVYCRGVGDSWSEIPGTAWGCVFKPNTGEAYQLALEVVEPSSNPGTTGRLLMEGGPPDFLP